MARENRLKSFSSALDDDVSNLSNVTGEFFCILRIAGDNVLRDKKRSQINNTTQFGCVISCAGILLGMVGWKTVVHS